MKASFTRRDVLSTALIACTAGAVASLPHPARAAEEQRVNDGDPLAAALGYTSDASRIDSKTRPAYHKGATCANCGWYEPTAAGVGRCNYFPGKLVDAQAWCQMYQVKPK
jgi:hypothetical protein